MSKTEETLSGSEILEWATKDLVICETGKGLHSSRSGVEPRTPNGIAEYGPIIQAARTSDRYTIQGDFGIDITRYANNGTRKIGYISGVNSDGSFQLYLLGNGSISLQPTHAVETNPTLVISGDLRILPPSMDYYLPEHASDFGEYLWGTTGHNIKGVIGYSSSGNISVGDSFMYQPEWVEISQTETSASIAYCAKKGNNYIIDNAGHINVELTNDIATTVKLGEPLECYFWQRSQGGWYYGDKNIGGDLYDLFNSMSINICTSVANMPTSVAFSEVEIQGATSTYTLHQLNTYQPFNGFMAYEYTPYNLILTYNLDEAKRYVETGELPSDAFLYPFDVDNIPINETGGTGAEDSDGTQGDDSISTGGDSGGEETDDQTPEAPTNTPQALTNNNLYWLTSQQLKGFIEWFWTDATDVTDPQELFEKIQGLYSDLSQAIVSIRYMPIDAEWVGGTTIDNSIIVGLVEKTEQVRTINKTVAPIRDIATDISISELPDFKGFINFSPYCEISLYLPFYGYLSLDADLLMQNKLTIKATYDILSGTIQYYIFRVSSKSGDATMINTVTGKMAVDIPISLQTKNERDSMIFNNVASATANLIGAGASAVAGNPIGMVMSTSAIAGQQSQGAPMRVMGTIGESGAFYDHGYCAIFIKRPATNYPPQYARRVGYPYNGARKLEKTHGFIQCFNPYVEFTHMTVNDSDIQPPKPTAEEIETIYNALEEGVILP